MPTWVDYANALSQVQARDQEQRQNALLFQQQQADRQRAMAAQAAAGNALPQLFASGQPAAMPQIPAPPQAPSPGQASQPAPQPGGGAPLPGMGPAPGSLKPPIPPGGVAGGQPGALPPFRPMPTTPPQAQTAPQGAIPAPPAQAAATPAQAAATPAQQAVGGGFSLENAVKLLKDQGLDGADLFTGLQQLMPLLDRQAQLQATQAQQQFNRELQVARLEQQHEAIVQRANDASLNRESREQIAGLARQSRMELAQFRLNATGANAVQNDAKLDSDTIKMMAGDYLAAPDPSIFTNLGRGRQGAANVVALREEIAKQAKDQGLTGADLAALRIGVGGEKAAARTAGTKATNVALAASEAQQTFPLVREASAAIPRTEMPAINKLMEAAQTGTGDPRWITLGTALNTAVNAYARAVSPSGTPTVSDKQHARDLLGAHLTDGQIGAALDIMNKEMQAAQEAPARVQAAQKARIAGGSKPVAIPQGWSVEEVK